ncbi:MAG: hypothetical protein ACR2FY_12155 [Pirellulaceae bacterium]
MRLTLRALLAYLYNVLEPAEAEEFAGKVQESPVASGLVQRIRGITHKIRMTAPRIDAKGLTDDANNVAEYLDNNLAEDRLEDFERGCLESDMHLAEVAGSYQILTMVLGKPATVPPKLRERVYGLPSEEADVHSAPRDEESAEKSRIRSRIVKAATAAVASSRPQAEVKTTSTHPVPEVPEYLKGGSQYGALTIVAAGLLVFLVVAAGIRMLGPYDRTNPALAWMYTNQSVVDAGTGQNGTPVTPEQKTDGSQSGDDKTSTEDSKGTPEVVVPDVPEEKSTEPTPTPGVVEKKETVTTKPMPEVSTEPTPGPAKTAPEPATTVPEPAKGPKIPLKPVPPVVVKKGGPELGRYTSDEQVLARYDVDEMVWKMVPTRDLIFAGERLQVLPTYRPQIALSSGAQITFAGESQVHLDAATKAGASRMTVHYGRMVVVTVGMPGVPLELDLTGLKGTLVLSDADAGVAIDSRRYLPPGSDPEKDPAFGVVEIFTTSGRATWQMEGAAEAIEIPVGHLLTYVLGTEVVEPDLAGPFRAPAWIDASSLISIDRVTSLNMLKMLEPEKPLEVRLQELLADPAVDVRALAARCLGYLDQFEPLVKDLSNVQHKAFWAMEIDSLHHAVSRGPETAVKVRDAAEGLRVNKGLALYRLLWGYSSEQLADIGAAELVDLLESPDVDIRVLAADNLRRITGALQNYRPEKRPDENRLAITRWKERLKDGTINYKSPPAPFMERIPLVEKAAPAAGKGK